MIVCYVHSIKYIVGDYNLTSRILLLKLFKMDMLAVVLAFALAFVCTKCQPVEVADIDSSAAQNGLKNLHEFLEDKFDGKVLKFDLNEVSKPGDSHNSKVWGLQVKLVKNNKNVIETANLN